MSEEEETKKVKFVFDLFSSDDAIDAVDVINGIYGLNLNPTRQLVNSLGGSETRGERRLKFEEFWDIYKSVRDNKDEGGFVEFVECLKIYDVGENGMMKLVDLTHMLLSLGERITQDQLDVILQDCQLEEEDDDGWFPYLPFLCRLCERPVPKSFKPT